MIVGVPGSGIGGLYYLLLAIAMPGCELYRMLRGQTSWRRWRLVLTQTALAAGILGAMTFTVWGIEEAYFMALPLVSSTSNAQMLQHQQETIRFIQSQTAWWAARIGMITLGCVVTVPAIVAAAMNLRSRLTTAKEAGPAA